MAQYRPSVGIGRIGTGDQRLRAMPALVVIHRMRALHMAVSDSTRLSNHQSIKEHS
jgi:hypothetical protein